MQQPKLRFHELLRQARENAGQQAEVMALLLTMPEEEYTAIERGERYPDNETLKRLCMMLEWNYYDAQRMIINEMTAHPLPTPARSRGEAALNALQSMPLQEPAARRNAWGDTLGSRLREVREETGQSMEIIALLLGVNVETYQRLEQGDTPTDELVRRISMVYDWNYQDLLALLRSEQARALQPRRIGSPYPTASPHLQRLKALLSEVEQLFARLPESEQPLTLAQLELIRETLRRQQPDAPGPRGGPT